MPFKKVYGYYFHDCSMYTQGLVIQNLISANPGLKVNPPFCFVCCFKTPEKKTPIDPCTPDF